MKNELLRRFEALNFESKCLNDNDIGAVTTGCLKSSMGLVRLDLSNNCLKRENVSFLGKALMKNDSLKKLYLRNNQIDDLGAWQISRGLMKNSTLTSLSLENNCIGDQGALYLAELLKTNITLKSLYLQRNYIGWKGALEIIKALQSNTSLIRVDLTYNSIPQSLEGNILYFLGDDILYFLREKHMTYGNLVNMVKDMDEKDPRLRILPFQKIEKREGESDALFHMLLST